MTSVKVPELTPKLEKTPYKPSDEEKKVIAWVYKRFEEMKTSPERKAAERQWKMGEAAWEAMRKPREEEDWSSNYVVPLVPAVVESILAEFVDQQQRPLILPRGEEDVPKATVMQHTFDYTWDVANGDMELVDVFKTALIKGTGIVQEYYKRDRRLVYDIIGISAKKKGLPDSFETKEREVFEYDDMMMESAPLEDVYVDEKASDFNRGKKARDCIRVYRMNIRDYQNFFTGPVWDPAGNAKYVKPGNEYDDYQDFHGISSEEDVCVLWYWSRSPKDALYIIANGVVQRMGPNIFSHKQLPFAKTSDIHRVGKFYGKGEPEVLESIADELTTLRRMTIDRHHLDLDKSFLVGNSALIDNDELISQPHNMIQVDDPSKIKPLEYGDIPQSVQFTTKSINDDAIRVTGIDDRFQSLQKTPSTATEAAILKESTLKRIKMKITMLQRGLLTDVSRLRVANIMQFYSQPKLERIIGEAGTAAYKAQVADLARRNLLFTTADGVPMKKTYRQIRIKGKELVPNAQGNIQERPLDNSSEFSFFEIKPELILPTASGGFDIRYEGGATLPISKPLQQSKAIELFDRLLPLTQVTNYDPEKLGDYLVTINDQNPDDFKKTAVLEDRNISNERVQMSVQLAIKENQTVIAGGEIPVNGTPYATPAHTEVHIAFLKSPQMLQAPDDVYQKLVTHISGEMAAIQQRSQGGGQDVGGVQQQATNPGGAAGIESTPTNAMGNINPSMIQGGGQVATGQALNPTT